MNATDDPTIPDDLDARLRTASQALDVSPAPLRAVERRARQRRRHQRTLVAGGAAVVVLLGALAVSAITDRGDGPDEVVTATDPTTPEPGRSVPQPLLLQNAGSTLDEVTPTRSSVWFDAGKDWQAIDGAVLADGRRFALSIGMSGTSTEGLTAISDVDKVGPPDRVEQLLDTETKEGESDWVGLVGTSGTELILLKGTVESPMVHLDEETGLLVGPENSTLDQTTTIVGFDVDTGAERTILTFDAAGQQAAASDVLARSFTTDCTIEVSSLSSSEPDRTVHGGCPEGIAGLSGLALDLAVSPDGRYVAAVWQMIRETGPGETQLSIVDLESGTTVQTADLTDQAPEMGMAWTGEHELTVAVPPGAPATNEAPGTITIQLATAPHGPS